MSSEKVGQEFFKALNRYFTPLAVGIVICGLITHPEIPQAINAGCIVLLVATMVINMVTASVILSRPALWRQIGYFRVGINLVFNAGFFILLHNHWPIIWLLFFLGPVAMALYGDDKKTFLTLGVVSLVLLGTLFLEGQLTPPVLGETLTKIFFMLLVSLFVIRVSYLIRQEK